MYIALSLLVLFSVAGAVTFYSGYVACRYTLRIRTEEYIQAKQDLDFARFQNETLRKEIREEKNKNLVLESLLKQAQNGK